MKILIGTDYNTTYTFNKVAKTITLGNLPYTPKLEELLLITDVTNNTIIYNFADPTKGATIRGNIITLTYDTNTGAFNNTDKLQIYYYLNQPQGTAIEDVAITLKQLLQQIKTPMYINSQGQQRGFVEGGVLNTVSTVTNVTALASIAGIKNIEDIANPAMYNVWYNNVRTRIN